MLDIYPPYQKPEMWNIDPGIVAYNAARMGLPMPAGLWVWPGGNWPDLSGQNRNGDFSAVTLVPSGVNIATDAGYIDLPDSFLVDGDQNRTIIVRGKTTKTTASGVPPYLFSYGSAETGQKWGMRLDDANSFALRLEIHGGYISGGIAGNDGELHTFISVLDGTLLSDILLYVDGEKQSITASANTNTAINTVTGGYYNNIGNENRNTLASWKGDIEYAYVFPQAFTKFQAAILSADPYGLVQQPRRIWGYVAAPPVGAIMNQFQGVNLGADLFNGTLL